MRPRGWEPAIVRVEDAGAEWRVFYNSRATLRGADVGSTEPGGRKPGDAWHAATVVIRR